MWVVVYKLQAQFGYLSSERAPCENRNRKNNLHLAQHDVRSDLSTNNCLFRLTIDLWISGFYGARQEFMGLGWAVWQTFGQLCSLVRRERRCDQFPGLLSVSTILTLDPSLTPSSCQTSKQWGKARGSWCRQASARNAKRRKHQLQQARASRDTKGKHQ